MKKSTKEENATWNKAVHKLQLLSDLERQIVNASIAEDVNMWVKYLRAYVMLVDPYIKTKYMPSLLKIMKEWEPYNDKPINQLDPKNRLQFQVTRTRLITELTKMQVSLTGAIKEARLDIPWEYLKTTEEKLEDAYNY